MKAPSVRNGCECWYHRFHVVHTLPGDELIYDHSQGTWDTDLKGKEGIESFPSRLYKHGMTASQLCEAAEKEKVKA